MKRVFYILLNLIILAGLVLGVFKIKDLFSGNITPDSEKATQEKLDGSKIAEEISSTKEEIENKTPPLSDPFQKFFQWQYKGKNYSISQKLYRSIYDFYKSQPKTYTYFNELPADWEEEYYGMFIAKNEKYNFSKEFLDEIVLLGEKNKLSDDQIVELVVAFVQAIPYDDEKAVNILSRAGRETMNYPYETLFKNTGVCSDKSFLAISLLRELGYGTAIFVYDGENHMAIGIQCPEEYSNYGSGYCYAETTSIGNKIGIIPELKAYAGKAVGGEEMSYFNENGSDSLQTTKLGEVKIFQKTQGIEYKGIIQTTKTNNEIVSLKKEIYASSSEIKSLKDSIDEMTDNLESQRKKLDKYLKANEIEKYNDKTEDYNNDLEEYDDMVKNFNKKVGIYNEDVARYNYLIKL